MSAENTTRLLVDIAYIGRDLQHAAEAATDASRVTDDPEAQRFFQNLVAHLYTLYQGVEREILRQNAAIAAKKAENGEEPSPGTDDDLDNFQDGTSFVRV